MTCPAEAARPTNASKYMLHDMCATGDAAGGARDGALAVAQHGDARHRARVRARHLPVVQPAAVRRRLGHPAVTGADEELLHCSSMLSWHVACQLHFYGSMLSRLVKEGTHTFHNVRMRHCKQVPVDVRLPAVGREAVEGPELVDASGSSSEDDDATDMADAQVPFSMALTR